MKIKATFRDGVERIKRYYRQFLRGRSRGLRDEVRFWNDWFTTKGLEWPTEFQQRLDPTTPLAPHLQALVSQIPATDVNILDVGAGPLTALGKYHPDKCLHITATDVLASEYDKIIQTHHITPPVRTIYADTERLTQYYKLNSFDIVFTKNALDHMTNPLLALQQMLAVVKANRYVVLEHREKEAENENFSGLHQWNFMCEDGSFIMQSLQQKINISQVLEKDAEIKCVLKDSWLQVYLLKRA